MPTGNARFDFSSSVVLVTGGGTGIGRAIARAFLDAGATVAVTGRRKELLDETIRGVAPEKAVAIPADLADKHQIDDLVDGIVDRYGRLDVVVSNAAGLAMGSIVDLDDADWDQLRGGIVDAFFHLAKRTLPVLAEHGGNLVAVTSTTGMRGEWNQAAYGAAKAAVSNFVRSLALDWGTAGVRVNAVAPSLTWSDRTNLLKDYPQLHEQAVGRIALGRLAEPEEIALAVLFLASDGARFVTGAELPVDGGTSAAAGQFRFDPSSVS
jgi:meso-butanediol dehydrogenase/(S,S)-butanediol dehydrogenase/diacetyl reductase